MNGVADERVIADDGTFRSVSAEYMGNDITISRMGTFFIITSEEYEPVYHEVPDADYKYYSLSSRPDIIEVPDDYEYIDYLSTSYVVEIKGDISPNPDIPYYVSEETDIAKVLLVFNEYDELLDHRIFDVCSQLNSYAVIYMTR